MDVFAIIEGSVAITRHPKGILKQSSLYQRGKDVFIRLNGGFCKIMPLFGDTFLTANPDVKVLEFEADHVSVEKDGSVRFLAPTKKLKAV